MPRVTFCKVYNSTSIKQKTCERYDNLRQSNLFLFFALLLLLVKNVVFLASPIYSGLIVFCTIGAFINYQQANSMKKHLACSYILGDATKFNSLIYSKAIQK